MECLTPHLVQLEGGSRGVPDPSPGAAGGRQPVECLTPHLVQPEGGSPWSV